MQKPTVTATVHPSEYSKSSSEGSALNLATEVGAIINLIGCPLLLTGMCVERYIAVVKPVLYLKSRKWEHRMALSLAVWCITAIFAVAMGKY